MTSWTTRYIPPDKNQWRGRSDSPVGSSFFQIIRPLNLLEFQTINPTTPSFALLGFKCDEGIRRNHGRPGAAEGPNSIRQALAKLPIHHTNFNLYDAGNIVCSDADLESAQAALGETVALLLKEKLIPIILGGGHELAWGHYQGINQIYRDKHLGIVNFDAHFDMRPTVGHLATSGTPFLQIAESHAQQNLRFDYNCIGIQHVGNIRQLFDTAKKYDTKIILADEFHMGQIQKCVDFVDRAIDENQAIYTSICMDVFAAPFAPGVSAAQTLGLCPWHVIPLLRQLAASGKVISYDIAELSPRYDIDLRTSKLAATLIYEIAHHHSTHIAWL